MNYYYPYIFVKASYFCHCLCSLLYFDIEAVIDGEIFSVGLAIPEKYSLHKLWVDIRDACLGHPIRNANGIKVQVIFPWQTE